MRSLRRTERWWRPTVAVASVIVLIIAGVNLRQFFTEAAQADDNLRQTRGRLLSRDPRIRKQGDHTFVWAGPRAHPPGDEKAQWFDFTGAPFPANELQFGIGMDSIRAIDDPLFVKPSDPRLLTYVGRSPYRRDEVARTNDEIRVIGVVQGKIARAYPIALLDRHEVVNDRFEGKPVAVGW